VDCVVYFWAVVSRVGGDGEGVRAEWWRVWSGRDGAYLRDGDGLVRHDGLWDGGLGQTRAAVVAVFTEALLLILAYVNGVEIERLSQSFKLGRRGLAQKLR
jgi:hypothetical protein